MGSDIRKEFSAAGFELLPGEGSPGTIAVKKHHFLQYLEPQADSAWLPLGRPYFVIGGSNYELEDRGYQKFWRAWGKRFPIRKADLEALHRFDEEVRAILHWGSLYNESLGSTCARTDYDRLQGRPEE
jgi:hypothetical protein